MTDPGGGVGVTGAAGGAPAATGAYGLIFEGLEPSPTLAVLGAEHWERVKVTVSAARVVTTRAHLDEAGARVGYESVHVDVNRLERRVQVTAVEPVEADTLAHPYLAYPSAVFAHWAGHQVLHAAAAVVGGRAWGLVGDSEDGKSTLLAGLFVDGHQALADDVLVVAGGAVLAGPRCIDLRDEATDRLGLAGLTDKARAQTRDRVRLAPVAAEVPLGGFVHLAWGDRVEMVALGAEERIRRLLASRYLWVRPPPASVLDLVALPAWELRRPRDWASFDAAARLVVATINGQ